MLGIYYPGLVFYPCLGYSINVWDILSMFKIYIFYVRDILSIFGIYYPVWYLIHV